MIEVNNERLWTKVDLARAAGISDDLLRYYIVSGRIPNAHVAVEGSSRLYYPETDAKQIAATIKERSRK